MTNWNKAITIEQMEQELRNINFFVGGLTDEGIVHYYNKMNDLGKFMNAFEEANRKYNEKMFANITYN